MGHCQVSRMKMIVIFVRLVSLFAATGDSAVARRQHWLDMHNVCKYMGDRLKCHGLPVLTSAIMWREKLSQALWVADHTGSIRAVLCFCFAYLYGVSLYRKPVLYCSHKDRPNKDFLSEALILLHWPYISSFYWVVSMSDHHYRAYWDKYYTTRHGHGQQSSAYCLYSSIN